MTHEEVREAWNVDPMTGTSTVLWSNTRADVWGMAYAPGTNTIYASSGSELFAATPDGTPTSLGGISNDSGVYVDLFGLAWANGGLYATGATGSVSDEALYRIDLGTLVATRVLDYEQSFGGLAFNPTDGLFYGTNNGGASGLYSIDAFGSGGITLVTPYPVGEEAIDGLAIGNGIAFLVEDQGGESIHPYDLGASSYLPSLISPMLLDEIYAGAAYIVPEPCDVIFLTCGLLFFMGQRLRRV